MVSAAAAKEQLSGSQRAAILVMYLDRAVAQRLLRQLDDGEVREVGMAMASIDTVPPVMIEEVVRSFVRDLANGLMVPRSGVDFVDQVLPGLIDADRQENIIPVLRRRVDRSFERFIAQRPPGAVAALLKDERPQAQAVALALMGPDNAAKVLKMFEPDDQLEITLRMARLKQIPGELADDVMAAVREALGRQDDHLEIGGVDSTARILGKMKRSENDALLVAVEDSDFDLADTLRRRMVVFDDLVGLNNRSVQALIKQVAREDLLPALYGTSEEMRSLFLANVSKRAAEDMREEMTLMVAPSRSAIRSAQERIVGTAMKLAEEGTIALPFGDDGDDA